MIERDYRHLGVQGAIDAAFSDIRRELHMTDETDVRDENVGEAPEIENGEVLGDLPDEPAEDDSETEPAEDEEAG